MAPQWWTSYEMPPSPPSTTSTERFGPFGYPVVGKQPMETAYTTTVTDLVYTASISVEPLAEQTSTTSSISTSRHSGVPFKDFDRDEHHMSTGVMAAAGVVATIIFILILVGLCFCLFRRSKKSKERDAANKAITNANEAMAMKETTGSNVVDVRAFAKPVAEISSHSTTSPSESSSSSSSSNSRSQHSAPRVPPVILSTSMGHNYFTGIDTSDHISLADNRSANTIDSDEPPPPYRPRSVPPISRECSVHIADGMGSNYRPGAIISPLEESIHNPFDDPDGNISDPDDYSPRHDHATPQDDHLSIVSDLSYQQEPTTCRNSV